MKQRTMAKQIAATQVAQVRAFAAGLAKLPFRMRLRVALLIACRGNPHAEVLAAVGLIAAAVLALVGVLALSLWLTAIIGNTVSQAGGSVAAPCTPASALTGHVFAGASGASPVAPAKSAPSGRLAEGFGKPASAGVPSGSLS